MSLKHSWSLILVLVLAGCCGKSLIIPPLNANAVIPQAPYQGVFTEHQPDSKAHQTMVPINIAPGFTVQERQDILSAVTELNKVFNGYKILIVTDQDLRVNNITISPGDLPDNRIGETNSAPGDEITLDTVKMKLVKYSDNDFTMVTIHELLHALGLQHIEIKWTVMFPSHDYSSKCVDEITVAQIASVLDLNKENLNWCLNPR